MKTIRPAALAAFALAGCAHAALDAADQRRAVTLAPYQRPIGFASLILPEGSVLYPARVDGEAAWCTARPAYFALGGEARAVCLFDPRGGREAEGWMTGAYVLDTLARSRLEVSVPYRVMMAPPLPPRP